MLEWYKKCVPKVTNRASLMDFFLPDKKRGRKVAWQASHYILRGHLSGPHKSNWYTGNYYTLCFQYQCPPSELPRLFMPPFRESGTVLPFRHSVWNMVQMVQMVWYRLILFRSTHYFTNSAKIWQMIFHWIVHLFTNFSINCFKFKT